MTAELLPPDDGGDLYKVYADQDGYLIEDVATLLRELVQHAPPRTCARADALLKRLTRARAAIRVDGQVVDVEALHD